MVAAGKDSVDEKFTLVVVAAVVAVPIRDIRLSDGTRQACRRHDRRTNLPLPT